MYLTVTMYTDLYPWLLGAALESQEGVSWVSSAVVVGAARSAVSYIALIHSV